MRLESNNKNARGRERRQWGVITHIELDGLLRTVENGLVLSDVCQIQQVDRMPERRAMYEKYP